MCPLRKLASPASPNGPILTPVGVVDAALPGAAGDFDGDERADERTGLADALFGAACMPRPLGALRSCTARCR
jgi:hypothetical protein